MKITRISSTVVNANMRNWIFVKVETDQDGLYGWGEATLEWKTAGVVGSVEDVSRLLIGEDPRRIEHLYQIMTRQYFWRAGIEGMSAISGIEQALWDIKGKALGVPVYELLGGKQRDRIPTFASTSLPPARMASTIFCDSCSSNTVVPPRNLTLGSIGHNCGGPIVPVTALGWR